MVMMTLALAVVVAAVVCFEVAAAAPQAPPVTMEPGLALRDGWAERPAPAADSVRKRTLLGHSIVVTAAVRLEGWAEVQDALLHMSEQSPPERHWTFDQLAARVRPRGGAMEEVAGWLRGCGGRVEAGGQQFCA